MRILLLLVVVGWHVGNFDCAAGRLLYTPSKSSEHSVMTFTAKSLKPIAGDAQSNVIYSPVSAWLFLVMTAYVSGGNTHAQIRSVLSLPNNTEHSVNDARLMINDFADHTDYQMLLTNRIFIDQDIQPNLHFLRFADIMFKSVIHCVDFWKPDVASRTINEWAAYYVNNRRIGPIVDPETLNKRTTLLLANVVRFKAGWVYQFPSESTVEKPFHLRNNTIIQVPTMYTYNDYVYGELPNSRATFVKIPYKVQPGAVGLSMFVILPDKIAGLSSLLDNFESDFVQLFDIGISRKLHLELPKFTIESSIDLRDSLIKIGIVDMFKKRANLTHIADDSEISFGKFVQKVVIDVDETGSEDVALNRYRTAPRVTPIKLSLRFAADRPFVCVIATDSKIPLFTAIITSPKIIPS